jgi:uncharacterized protein YjdB
MNSAAKALFKTISIIMFLWIIPIGCRTGSVSPPPPATLVSLSISPANPSIAPGTTIQLTAQGTFSNGAKQNLTSSVTWDSLDHAIASVSDTAGSKGFATAVSTGTTTITATSGTISGLATITTSSVASISVAPLNPPIPSIAPGTTQQFTATGTLENADTQSLTAWATWASLDTGVVTISNVSGSKGLANAVAAGSAMISATYGGVSGLATFTSSSVASIDIFPTAASIAKGTTQQFTATGTLADATTQSLTTWATWTSSNAGVATIGDIAGSKGLATAVSEGTATISSTFSGVSSLATLTVTPAVLTSITVTPANPSIALGTTQQFTATGTFTDNSTQNITSSVSWNSSKTNVATISNVTGTNGLATSVGVGTTTITATSGSISGTTTLSVTQAVLESIEVTPASAIVSIAVRNTQQFTATGIFTDGSQDLTTSVNWSSSNPNIPISNTQGSQGLATDIFFSAGSTDITATFSGITSNIATLTFF